MDFKYPTSALLRGYATKTRRKRQKKSIILYSSIMCIGLAAIVALAVSG